MRIKIQVKNQFDCSCNILERHCTTNYEKHILRDMRNATVEIQGKGQWVQSFWLAGRHVVVHCRIMEIHIREKCLSRY